MSSAEERRDGHDSSQEDTTTSEFTPPTAPALPLRIGRYRIVRFVAQGGMGSVWEAVDETLSRTVALKVARLPLAGGSHAADLTREAKTLAQLAHPSIASVFDAGIVEIGSSEHAYIAMEFVPNAMPITSWAEVRGIGLRERINKIVDVCDAIEFAHNNGVIHCDLKPSNVLVDGDGRVKVIDFGVSRILGMDESAQGIRGLSPRYAAPEQKDRDAHGLDERSDVFALGVLLRELAEKQSSTRTNSRQDLRLLIAAATQPDRNRRISTASELGSNLRALLAGTPLPIRSANSAYVIGKILKGMIARWQVPALAIVAVIAFCLGKWVAIPLVHRWTGLDRGFVRALMGAFEAPSTARTWDHVAVVTMNPDLSVETLAAAEQIEGVSSQNLQSLRLLHGRAMEKLASAGPRAVVWDIMFRTPSEFDADFVRGVEALKRAGSGVVVGTRSWELDASGLPQSSPEILRAAQWGVFAASLGPDQPWVLHLVLVRDHGTGFPSLALSGYIASKFPGKQFDATLDMDQGLLRIRPWLPVQGVPNAKSWVGAGEVIRLSGVIDYPSGAPSHGVLSGDRIGALVVDLPPEEALSAATLDYAEIFTLTPEELRAQIRGRVVVIGDARATNDIFGHPSGRRIPGAYAHASGIEALARGTAIRLPTPQSDGLLIALFGGSGVVLGAMGRGGIARRLGGHGALAICAAVLSIALLSTMSILLNSMVQFIAGAIGLEGASFVRSCGRDPLA